MIKSGKCEQNIAAPDLPFIRTKILVANSVSKRYLVSNSLCDQFCHQPFVNPFMDIGINFFSWYVSFLQQLVCCNFWIPLMLDMV